MRICWWTFVEPAGGACCKVLAIPKPVFAPAVPNPPPKVEVPVPNPVPVFPKRPLVCPVPKRLGFCWFACPKPPVPKPAPNELPKAGAAVC